MCFDGSSAFAKIGTGEWGLPRNHYFCHREGASFTTGAFAFHTVLELHTPLPSFFLVPFSFMSFLDRCSKVVEYQSVVFPDWDRGASWMREVARMPAGLRPASCRSGCNLFLAIQNVSWKEWRIRSRAEWHPTFQEAQRVQNTTVLTVLVEQNSPESVLISAVWCAIWSFRVEISVLHCL